MDEENVELGEEKDGEPDSQGKSDDTHQKLTKQLSRPERLQIESRKPTLKNINSKTGKRDIEKATEQHPTKSDNSSTIGQG